MADNQKMEARTQTKKDEAIFLLEMVRIIDRQGVFIGKYRLLFLEGEPMLSFVQGIFLLIPFKPNLRHNYSVTTPRWQAN